VKPLRQICLLFLLLILFGFRFNTARAEGARDVALRDPACDAAFSALVQDPGWDSQLLDPVITSMSDLSARLDLYSQVHACLGSDPASLSENERFVYEMTEYFMIFAGGAETPAGGSTLTLVLMDMEHDPAVEKIRSELAIAPPPGFIYMRQYASVDAMPALVQKRFADPGVAGVTLNTRYIAVLADPRSLASGTVPKTVSHELIHAYLNAAGGAKNLRAFPAWYDEGMAIYFSGSSDPACTIGDSSGQNCQTPEKYREYTDNFNYLESQLGSEPFLATLKQSFEQADASVLYRVVGLSSDTELAAKAHAWKQKQDTIMAFEIIGAVLGPIILIWLAWKLIMSLAERRAVRVPAYAGIPPSAPASSPAPGLNGVSAQSPPLSPRPAVRPGTPVIADEFLKRLPGSRVVVPAQPPGNMAAPDQKQPPAQPRVPPPPPAAAPSLDSAEVRRQLLARPPLLFPQVELANIERFWVTLLQNEHKLGSSYRVSFVLRCKTVLDRSGGQSPYKCTRCCRWAGLYLPQDITSEEYARDILSSLPQGAQKSPRQTVKLPYAICLYCGKIYAADEHGVAADLRLLDRNGDYCGAKPPENKG
jgi:hypothetical protein